MQVYPDEGLVLLLKLVVNNKGEGLTWALFESNTQVTLASELADFTLADVSWGQVVLDDTDFTLSQVLLNNGAIQAPTESFLNGTGSSKSIYGYVVFDQVTQKLVAASRDADAPTIVPDGSTYDVVPQIGDYSDVSIPEIDGGTF